MAGARSSIGEALVQGPDAIPVTVELLNASDEQIERAVEQAEPMALRGLLYQLTGDEEIAAIPVEKVHLGALIMPLVTRDEDVATLRRKTSEFLKDLRDSGPGSVDIGSRERLLKSMSLAYGDELANTEELGLAWEELAVDPWARSHDWLHAPSPEALQNFSVTVIGAGMGGLNAALMLKRAGIPYTLVEKNPGVGGTWWENRYPGARVDTPSRSYCHIFGARFPQPGPFCTQADNLRYFDWIADTFDLRETIAFETEARSLTWDEQSAMWEIETEGPEGRGILRSNAVITAVGFLNRPKLPEIEGMADFRGPSWHSARWPDDFDVRDKRIAVVGTGCSGDQLIAQLALEAGHVVAFQRTPQWLFGVSGYLSPYSPEQLWLDRNLPWYTNFLRLNMSSAGDGITQLQTIDPAYDDPYAVNEAHKQMREASLEFIASKIDDPELLAAMIPEHPPWSTRPVNVDREYSLLDAIHRDNVTFVTGGVRRITENGIEAADGTEYDVDAIVYATGFHASDYLYPMKITGRGGMTLEDAWRDDGPRTHRFSMIPGFPNLWTLYGANSNGGLLAPGFHEMVTRYALRCMEHLILDGHRAIEPREYAHRRFNEWIDERNARKVWSDPRAHSYYQSDYGRSIVMCPLAGVEVWSLLRYPPFDDELAIR